MDTTVDTADVGANTLIECVNCVKTLPLCVSRDLEQASVWICAGCGVSFVGLANPELMERQGRLVRLHDQYFDDSELPDIPLAIRRHVASQATRSLLPAHLEKRRSERMYNSMVVPAIQMDKNFVLHGNTLKTIITDISREGVGMAIPHELECDHLAIKFAVAGGSAIQAVVRVNRQRELSPPFIEIGCEFVARLGN